MFSGKILINTFSLKAFSVARFVWHNFFSQVFSWQSLFHFWSYFQYFFFIGSFLAKPSFSHAGQDGEVSEKKKKKRNVDLFAL
jgi:hypothetical protein